MKNIKPTEQKRFIPAVGTFFKRREPAEFFILFMLFGLFIFLIACLFGGAKQLTSIFSLHGEDLFMDYFNSVRDVSQGTGAYTERHVIYPPMANLIFLICMKFMPAEYVSTSFEDRQLWVNYPSAAISCVLFLFIFTLLFLILCQTAMPFNHKKRALLSFFIIFNPPVLFLLERGNILLLSILSLTFYALTYHSENKIYRELGLLALAFSFSIKLYPAIFGLFLIVDKRYKEAIRCCIYALLMLLIPSFFFGGPKCIFWTFENILKYPAGGNHWKDLAMFFHVSQKTTKIVYLPVLFVICASFLVSSFLQKKRWKLWAFGCTFLISMPSLHALYAWVFMIIPLLFFFRSETLKGSNWLYFFGMLLPFLFIPTLFNDKNLTGTLNGVLMIPSLILLLSACLIDTVMLVRQWIKHFKTKEV